MKIKQSNPHSNYWGLVTQVGPWKESKIDKARRLAPQTRHIGDGIAKGGTDHAGHADWEVLVAPSITRYAPHAHIPYVTGKVVSDVCPIPEKMPQVNQRRVLQIPGQVMKFPKLNSRMPKEIQSEQQAAQQAVMTGGYDGETTQLPNQQIYFGPFQIHGEDETMISTPAIETQQEALIHYASDMKAMQKEMTQNKLVQDQKEDDYVTGKTDSLDNSSFLSTKKKQLLGFLMNSQKKAWEYLTKKQKTAPLMKKTKKEQDVNLKGYIDPDTKRSKGKKKMESAPASILGKRKLADDHEKREKKFIKDTSIIGKRKSDDTHPSRGKYGKLDTSSLGKRKREDDIRKSGGPSKKSKAEPKRGKTKPPKIQTNMLPKAIQRNLKPKGARRENNSVEKAFDSLPDRLTRGGAKRSKRG